MNSPFIESSFTKEDPTFELPLRPQTLSDFKGQPKVCERLNVLITAAKKRKDALGHTLFSGPPGLGKTTLATILAKEMGTNLVTTSGPVIEKAGDLAGVLTTLEEGDILFIDELHRMSRQIEEYLYPAMEDFSLDLMIDSGPSARSVKVNLKKFTLVGATTRLGLLSAPLRTRFAFSSRLDYYEPQVLEQIIMRSSRILDLDLEKEAALEIAKRSRGTARIANNLTKWVRDFALSRNASIATKDVVEKALSLIAVDEKGLDELDKKILEVIIDHYDGGPVGINTIAVAVAEEKETIEDVHEPYLIMEGFLKRTPRGREATPLAYKHLGR